MGSTTSISSGAAALVAALVETSVAPELTIGGAQVDLVLCMAVVAAMALAILLGGGKDRIGEGLRKVEEMRARQVRHYLQRLESAMLKDRAERLNPALKMYAEGA